MRQRDKPIEKRFSEKVNLDGPIPKSCPELGPCHIWTGGTSRMGYGAFLVGGSMKGAHRYAFFLKHGRWPVPCALHHCDNPPCVNSGHLYEGTKSDNSRDCVRRGRSKTLLKKGNSFARGERNGSAKLTVENVLEIRSLLEKGGVLHKEIAEIYGVCRTVISMIGSGRAWSWVTSPSIESL